MEKENARDTVRDKKNTLKKLTIAQIVLCSISVIIAIITIVYVVIAFSKTNNQNEINNIANNVQINELKENNDDTTNIWELQYNTINLFKAGLNVTLAFSIINLLFCGFGLYCAIFILKNIDYTKRHKTIILLCTIAIFTSILTTHLIQFILFIIIAIKLNYINKSNKKSLNKTIIIKNYLLHKLKISESKNVQKSEGRHSSANTKISSNNNKINENILMFKNFLKERKKDIVNKKNVKENLNSEKTKGKHIK